MKILNKQKFYTLDNILSHDAQYNIIIGERSNGKTYASLEYGLKNYCTGHGQMALVRRWQDDFRGKRGASMFNSLVENDVIKKYTNGKWTDVYYYSGRWYLCKYDETDDNKRILDNEPFAYAFAISAMEHDKSTSYPNITTIIFDEFLSRGMYLPDEFILFMNVISTIVRQRNNVKIFMLGNTVNQYCPYFKEMGLTNIKSQKVGTIDVYTYGDSELKVAVEYSDTPVKKKDSDFYFAFNNPKLSMITGGAWELAIYPHCPIKYIPQDIRFIYFIVFDDDILQCEIIKHDDDVFTFIHRKTTELKNADSDLIFSPNYSSKPNWRRKINKPTLKIEQKIWSYFKTDKVFYQDNEVGEIVRNYIMWCDSDSIKNK